MNMGMEEIEIRVDQEGNVTLHVQGVHGEECRVITASLEEALGSVTERVMTGDFYHEVRIGNREKVERE